MHIINNSISELNKLQLQHLKYFIIFHQKLYRIYKTLLMSSSTNNNTHKLKVKVNNKTPSPPNRHQHISSSSSSKILSYPPSITATNSISFPFERQKKRKSSTTLLSSGHSRHHYADNPFLKALKCITYIDLNKSASSFAINKYNVKFLCDIIQCGFNVIPRNKTHPALYKC